MALFRTTPPGAEPVTLTDAKQHLKLDHDSGGRADPRG